MCRPPATRLYGASRDKILKELQELNHDRLFTDEYPSSDPDANAGFEEENGADRDGLEQRGYSHTTTAITSVITNIIRTATAITITTRTGITNSTVPLSLESGVSLPFLQTTTTRPFVWPTFVYDGEDEEQEDDDYIRWKEGFLSEPAVYTGPEVENYEEWRDEYVKRLQVTLGLIDLEDILEDSVDMRPH